MHPQGPKPQHDPLWEGQSINEWGQDLQRSRPVVFSLCEPAELLQ
jgi:hypothetical protein